MTKTKRLFLGVLVATSIGAATLAAVTNVNTTVVSQGTTLSVDGSGFGTAPKASLVVGSRKVGLAMVRGTVSDTHFAARLARLPRGVSGSATLRVTPRGAATPFDFPGFTIPTPQIAGIGAASGVPKDDLRIDGASFGLTPVSGRAPAGAAVRFGVKKARITNWSNGTVYVVVPKLLPGTYDVTVANNAGSSTLASSFTVLDPISSAEHFFATVAGTELSITTAADVDGVRPFPLPKRVKIGVAASLEGGVPRKFIGLNVYVDPTKGFPQTVTGLNEVFVRYDEQIHLGGPPSNTKITNTYESWQIADATVKIESLKNAKGGFAKGRFHATLSATWGGTLGPTIVVDGDFAVLLEN